MIDLTERFKHRIEPLAREYIDYLSNDNGVYSTSHAKLYWVLREAAGIGIEKQVQDKIDQILRG